MIIFTEHRDTLHYLEQRIAGVLGNAAVIVPIHGGTHRDERRKRQALFGSDPEVRLLIATDAAGEGVNLQNVNLMVNYDLPWNPNRLEQRLGRIHRIEQQEVCHLWNLLAKETREGEVFYKLLKKIEKHLRGVQREGVRCARRLRNAASRTFSWKQFGMGISLRFRARLTQRIETALDPDRLKEILQRNALAQETMSAERLFAVKEEMEKAEARRLQPFFCARFSHGHSRN